MDAPLTVKYVIIPVMKNTLFVRFENVGDKFDNPNMNGQFENQTYYIDVKLFA